MNEHLKMALEKYSAGEPIEILGGSFYLMEYQQEYGYGMGTLTTTLIFQNGSKLIFVERVN